MQQVPFSAKIRQNPLVLLIRRLWTLTTVVGYIHAAEYLNSRRATYPGLLFRAGTIAVGIVMATAAMHMVSTGFGRIAEDIILQAGTAIGLIALFVIIGIMFYGTVLSFRHVRQTWNEDNPEAGPKLLTAPTWTPPQIGIDRLICLLPGESLSAFTARAKAEEAETTHAIWAVYIPPFQKQAAIYTADKATDFIFNRGDEPFNFMLQENLRLPAGIDHAAEDERQYQKYVEWFAPRYRRWIDEGAKIEADKGRAKQTLFEIMEGHAKLVSTLCLAMLFCLPAFGQSKTRQVDEALGTRIREIPEVGEKIVYAFREGGKEKYYTRTGDGRSDYTALLQTTSGLIRFNDQGGQLIAVQKNGEIVARAENVERVNLSPVGPNGAPYLEESTTGDPIRPRGVLTAPDVENTPKTDQPMRFSIPDSSTTDAMMERWKENIRAAEERTGRAAKPAFDFSWWLFGEIFIFLFILSSVLWHFAKTASEEGIMGAWGETIFISSFLVTVHQNCSALLMCVLWFGECFIFIKGAHLLMTTTLPLLIACGIWFAGLWLMRKIHNKIVPNIKGLVGRGRNTNTGMTPY